MVNSRFFTAEDKSANILDMYWWRFYVLCTQRINSDPKLNGLKTISLKKIEKLCSPVQFDNLTQAIDAAAKLIS